MFYNTINEPIVSGKNLLWYTAHTCVKISTLFTKILLEVIKHCNNSVNSICVNQVYDIFCAKWFTTLLNILARVEYVWLK